MFWVQYSEVERLDPLGYTGGHMVQILPQLQSVLWVIEAYCVCGHRILFLGARLWVLLELLYKIEVLLAEYPEGPSSSKRASWPESYLEVPILKSRVLVGLVLGPLGLRWKTESWNMTVPEPQNLEKKKTTAQIMPHL